MINFDDYTNENKIVHNNIIKQNIQMMCKMFVKILMNTIAMKIVKY